MHFLVLLDAEAVIAGVRAAKVLILYMEASGEVFRYNFSFVVS